MRVRPDCLIANEQREAREGKTAGHIVDHVYLTEIQTRLQGFERNVNLEDDRFAIGGGDFVRDDWLGFVDLRSTLEKFDAGEDADGTA